MRKDKQKQLTPLQQLLLAGGYVLGAGLIMTCVPWLVHSLVEEGVDLQDPGHRATKEVLRMFDVICFCGGLWMLMRGFRHGAVFLMPSASDKAKSHAAWGCFLLVVTIILTPTALAIADAMMGHRRVHASIILCLMAFLALASFFASAVTFARAWRGAKRASAEKTSNAEDEQP